VKDYRSNRDVERIRDRLRTTAPLSQGSSRYRYRNRAPRRSAGGGIVKTVGVVVAAAFVVIGPYWISGLPFGPGGTGGTGGDAVMPRSTSPSPSSPAPSGAALQACRDGTAAGEASAHSVTPGTDFLQIVLCRDSTTASLDAVTALNEEWHEQAVARRDADSSLPSGCTRADATSVPAVVVARDHRVSGVRYLACGQLVIDDFQLTPSHALTAALQRS